MILDERTQQNHAEWDSGKKARSKGGGADGDYALGALVDAGVDVALETFNNGGCVEVLDGRRVLIDATLRLGLADLYAPTTHTEAATVERVATEQWSERGKAQAATRGGHQELFLISLAATIERRIRCNQRTQNTRISRRGREEEKVRWLTLRTLSMPSRVMIRIFGSSSFSRSTSGLMAPHEMTYLTCSGVPQVVLEMAQAASFRTSQSAVLRRKTNIGMIWWSMTAWIWKKPTTECHGWKRESSLTDDAHTTRSSRWMHGIVNPTCGCRHQRGKRRKALETCGPPPQANRLALCCQQ